MTIIAGVMVLTVLTFTTSCGQGDQADQGKTLNTIVIGEQEWTSANLDVTFFRNGDPIFEANSYEKWEEANIKGIPAWCYYENNPENGKIFGKLYNYWAVSDPRDLAPEGWTIPTAKDWESLAETLGGLEQAGEKLKSTHGWIEGGHGDNESGFSGLPGGYRSHETPGFMWGPFYGEGKEIFWWSKTGYLVDNVWAYKLSYQNNALDKDSFVKTSGLYVRLLKD